MLQGKKVLLAVCGSIAAYKAANLIRLLTKSGAEVKVIMTASACDFITPLTLATLSGNPVSTDFVHDPESGVWNSHVEMGLWADLMLVAPASANTVAKAAQGICDNFLQAVYLSARCPVWWAPAMDLDMWMHESTQANIKTLASFGDRILQPGTGSLASGLEGKGRLMEPEELHGHVVSFFEEHKRLQGKIILVTAGPTYEAIDPVRFIGNRSTGKMGYALAEELADQGAKVILISGPTSLVISDASIHRIDVESAAEMKNQVLAHFERCDAAVFSAAVADYTPVEVAHQKIKKKDLRFDLALEKTEDIAALCGAKKKAQQFIVGFALETEHEEANALAKMNAKNQNMIVLNSLQDAGAGFASDTNKITVFTDNGGKRTFELKTKKAVAKDIIDVMFASWLA